MRQGYTRTPLKNPTSYLDWLKSRHLRSRVREKKKTRHPLACNCLCSAAFWMKEASAKDTSLLFRLIHSNRTRISWVTTAWCLKLILLNVFPHANPQILGEETEGRMLSCSLEKNERPSLWGTAAASSVSAGLLFQPSPALQRNFSSQVGLNIFFGCLLRKNFFRVYCGFSDIIIICIWIAWCMSQQ